MNEGSSAMSYEVEVEYGINSRLPKKQKLKQKSLGHSFKDRVANAIDPCGLTIGL